MNDKIIVTNKSALRAKYAPAGLAAITKSVNRLIAADKQRGIATRLIALDDASAMRRFRASPVTDAGNCKQNKNAIDAIHRKLSPDYLLILGSSDVIAHQDLNNPVYEPPDDDDPKAWGDLPYACDAPYSRDTARFVGPTRVVGRLPGLTGAADPAHLLRLLDTARSYVSRPPRDYAEYFGLSARVWSKSTALSLDNVFGNHRRLRPSPPRGPSHPASVLGARSHFINCHGAIADPRFYGQSGRSFPTALTSRGARSKILAGTIAAVECCYGAELYDADTFGVDTPICQSYLGQGAYGYVGSSTIAYGPAAGNGAADLLTQYFLLEVLGGASIGRAMLIARQRFVHETAEMDPVDLKTLAQFCLYGDPSVHPVRAEGATRHPDTADAAVSRRVARRARRTKLRAVGEFLKSTKPTAAKRTKAVSRARSFWKVLANIAFEAGLSRTATFRAFSVKGGGPSGASRKKVPTAATSRYYLAIGAVGKGRGKPRSTRVVLAKEAGERIIAYRVYERR